MESSSSLITAGGKSRSRTAAGAMLVAAAAAALYLPWLGSITLFDVDEPRFAEAARVMYRTGDFIVPYFNGAVRYDKPPLIYWVMSAGYALFGVNELGARIGSAVAGIASAVMVYLLAIRMCSWRAATIAGLIAATALMVCMESRLATADAVLLLTVMAMFTGFWRVVSGRRSLASYALLYGGLAAGSLAKGPVSAAVLVVSVVLYAAMCGERQAGASLRCRARLILRRMLAAARELSLGWGFLAAAAVVVAWFIPALIATKGGFLTHGFGHHVVQRSFGRKPIDSHGGVPIIFYLVILPVTFYPWFAVLPESLRRFWRSDADRRMRAFLLAWAVAPFIVFSFLRTKLFHYTLPAYPALAVICGIGIGSALRGEFDYGRHWLGKAGLAIFAIVCLVAAGVLVFPPPKASWPGLSRAMIPAAAGIVMLGAAGIVAFGRRTRIEAVGCMFVLTVATWLLAVNGAARSLQATATCKAFAEGLRPLLKPDDALAYVRRLEPSLVFYLQRTIVEFDRDAGPEVLLADHPRVVCIASTDDSSAMEACGGRLLQHARCFATRKMRWLEMDVWEITRAGGSSPSGKRSSDLHPLP